MYVYQRQVSLHRGIATLLAIALVLWGIGAHMFTSVAEAANLTSVSDTLTDSAPGESSVHTIAFSAPSGIAANAVFTVNFPSTPDSFDLSSLVVGDVTMTVGGVATTTGAAAGVATWGVGISSDAIEFTNCSNAACVVASTSQLVLTIGDEQGTMIVNPSGPTATSSGTYQIAIGNTDFDTNSSSTIADGGYARVAIVDNVEVSANVETTLSFTIAGVGQGADVNGSPTTTTATSTSVTLPFGTLVQNVSKTLAQRLNVSTNARNGYVVTVEQDTQLQSSTGADIDGFVDGNWTTTPTGWAAPGNDINDEDTWGHWGLTSTDGDTTRSSEFTSDTWVAASTTPVVVMSHDNPADGVTNGVGSSTVGYQVQITALQEAGDDYSTTLTYIATPTF